MSEKDVLARDSKGQTETCLLIWMSIEAMGVRQHETSRWRLFGRTLVVTNLAGLFFWLYGLTHRDLVVPHLTRGFRPGLQW